jgi:pimeloyl-ACP methyl ester carboxylesterase
VTSAAVDAFDNGSLRFRVADRGPRDGDAVVLLHGFPQDSTCWDAVVPLLTARGLRTLAFDQRGYAPEARPRGRLAYRLPLLVGDVVALLDAAGIRRAHVVGHDWGGAVAWGLGSWRAERVRTVSVLSTPHPAAFARALLTSRQGLLSWYMLAVQPPGLAERLVGAWHPAGERRLRRLLRATGTPAVVAERALALAADRERFTAMLGWYRAIPLVAPRQSMVPCRVPALYVWPTRDMAIGRRAAELTRRHVAAPYRFEVLDGASHWLPEEHPQTVARLVADHVAAHGDG